MKHFRDRKLGLSLAVKEAVGAAGLKELLQREANSGVLGFK